MVSNVVLSPFEEAVNWNNLTENDRRGMPRPEQKTAALVKGPLQKLSKQGKLALDTFAKMLCTVKAFLVLDKHKRFVECEKDSGFVENPIARLAGLYAC